VGKEGPRSESYQPKDKGNTPQAPSKGHNLVDRSEPYGERDNDTMNDGVNGTMNHKVKR
jgi:hypothetical protein